MFVFLGNDSSEVSEPQTTVAQTCERHCKSLPASPTSSPQMHQKTFSGNLGRSMENFQVVRKTDPVEPLEQSNVWKNSEVFRRMQEEHLISSCESAKTVVDLEERTAEMHDVPKEEEEMFEKTSEIQEAKPEMKQKEDGAALEKLLRRPNDLKGLYPFQKNSNLAGLGLAFSFQGGSTIARWPSLADKSLPTEEWEQLTFPSAERAPQKSANGSDRSEDCLVLVCCGLYHLLRGVLLILPDVMLQDVMDKLIQPDVLIVLVNHPSTLIQQGVIKLLDAYFRRATREQKEKFLKNRGFSLLANQLYLHQGTPELMECFMEMLFGRPVSLDEE
ncbi:UNVERIFIED_CONTAM: hypothetical protein K2H54_059137 [Gekko kuhli]